MIFAKYSFPDQTIWNNLKKVIYKDESYVDCAVVELGHLCQEKDEEGNCVIFEEEFAVDIMWFGEIPSQFNEYEIFPNPCGVHTFAGCEDLYLERFNQFNGS